MEDACLRNENVKVDYERARYHRSTEAEASREKLWPQTILTIVSWAEIPMCHVNLQRLLLH